MKITLVCGKEKKEVTPVVAQNILKIQKESRMGSWELPSNSPYEFKDNALIKRTDTEDCKGKAKPNRNTAGNKSPRKTEVSHRDNPA